LNLWNLYAKYYDSIRLNPATRLLHRFEQESIQELLELIDINSAVGKALDLGTGSGTNLKYIPTNIDSVYALDKSRPEFNQ
jgi:hypothetical protein